MGRTVRARTLFNALQGCSVGGNLAIGIESEEVGLPDIREMLAIKLPTEYCLVAGAAQQNSAPKN